MAGLKDPLSDNTMPKYLYSLVASSGDELNVKWGSSFFLLNETVFVLLIFIFRSHVRQYSSRRLIDACKPV